MNIEKVTGWCSPPVHTSLQESLTEAKMRLQQSELAKLSGYSLKLSHLLSAKFCFCVTTAFLQINKEMMSCKTQKGNFG